MSALELAKDIAHREIQRRLMNEIRKRLSVKLAPALLNPMTWIVAFILFIIIIGILMMVLAMSNMQNIASSYFISKSIVPPVIAVHNYDSLVTSPFGDREDPITHVSAFHSGVDLGIPAGTPVQSSTDGVVDLVSYPKASDPESTKNAGTFVNVACSDPDYKDSVTRYLHLSEAFVTTGQVVKKGQIIGLSGNTGRSTGAHLHYEWQNGGTPVDPLHYIYMMSKLTDVASEEAQQYMEKVKWTDTTVGDYKSQKMLYLSDIIETNGPAPFKTNATAMIRSLNRGGYTDIGFVPNSAPTAGASDSGGFDYTNVSLADSINPFFIKYGTAAQQEERRSGVPASITLAQAALESSYGKDAICNNLFGIKAFGGWTGASCVAGTQEELGGVMQAERAAFRAYSSPAESFADHSDFLLRNSIYRIALTKNNPFQFANELQRAGYATDSQYANKLKYIIRRNDLYNFDLSRGLDTNGKPFDDVPMVSGGGFKAPGGEQLSFVFGLQQFNGFAAKSVSISTDSAGNTTKDSESTLYDPMTEQPIINLENYRSVLESYGGDTTPPNMFVTDLTAAVQVTLDTGTDGQIVVTNVQYVK